MSVSSTALARVRVSLSPESDGEPLSVTILSIPSRVFFTVNAPFDSDDAAPSFSLNITLSVVPTTAALDTVGRTPSTLWLASAATAECSSRAAVASFPARSAIVPPFNSSAFPAMEMPSASASPSATR